MTAARARPIGPALAWAEGSLRLAEVVHAQQGQLQAVIARLEQGGIEDIHQGRVAARRLRSVLRTFAPAFDERWARLYRMDLRSFARSLATVREADVHGGVLDDTAGSNPEFRPAELARLSRVLREERAAVREHLGRHAREHNWRALMKALEKRSEQPPRIVRTDVTTAEVLAWVDRAWRKARRLVKHRPREVGELHELRLALKHCRYALEVVADIEPKATSRLLRRLRRAQEAIGAHRDTVAAAHWVRSHERTLGRPTVARLEGMLVKREVRQRRAAARQGEKVLPAYDEWRTAIRPFMKPGGVPARRRA